MDQSKVDKMFAKDKKLSTYDEEQFYPTENEDNPIGQV